MSAPELVIMDPGGRHNADGKGTQKRLLKGGAWKRQNIVMIMPADVKLYSRCALAYWNLIWPPNQAVVRILAQGAEVGAAYSSAIEAVLGHPQLKEFQYILTCEQDNAPESNAVLRLIESMEGHPQFDAISGSYFTKGECGVWQGWGDVNDPVQNFRPQLPEPGKVKEVVGLGMGFCLYRMDLFQDMRLRRPFFVTQRNNTGCSTQDLYFWQDARKFGHRCAVDCDCHVGHFDGETMW